MSKLLSILKQGEIELDKLGGETHFEKELANHRQQLLKTFVVLFALAYSGSS